MNVGSPSSGYHFYVNGVNYSQWSEEFVATSIGVYPSILPVELSNIDYSLGTVTGESYIEANAYGLIGDSAYYLGDQHTLFAKNTGVPMVYGASNITRITKSSVSGKPSLLIPGHGFLNETGKHNDYTIEFWIRLENHSKEPRRIFGPVSGTSDFKDGIYVDGPFVKIKVGNSTGSHFIGEWSRPMLFDFRVGDGIASLLVNGEQVISMPISLDSTSFPSEFADNKLTGGRNIDQNWLGFYAYEDLPAIEIDCVAIYGYQVSSLLAKRRFAFGQAVDFPESINASYGGTSIFIDYPFAGYTNNYSYPDTSNFGKGITDNASVENGTISSPQYSLPDIVFQDNTITIDQWNISNMNNPVSDTTPVVTFNSNTGYLYFDKLSILKDDTKAIYGIFTASSLSNNEETLIRIQNKVTGDFLSALKINNHIVYKLNFGGIEEVLYTDGDIVVGDPFFTGIDIDALSSFFGKNVSSFFGNKSQLNIFIANDSSFSSGLSGLIHKIGFCTSKNLKKMRTFFNTDFSGMNVLDAGSGYYGESGSFWSSVTDGGSPGGIVISSAYNHVASYTLAPRSYFGSYKLDIDTESYWEDYLPLTYFSQYITDSFGNKSYDLDFIQFNIAYPALPIFSNGYYDTSDSNIKTYVSFKYDAVKPGNFDDVYVNRLPMSQTGTVEPGNEWINTAYEVVDGAIIYPPHNVDVKKISMTTHIEIITNGISDNPIKIKSIQYSSEAFNSIIANPVGTRFGNNIYPYKKYGAYYDYKGRNPFRIYKGSTPYLYLTRDSGIEKVGVQGNLENRGLSIPINENIANEYKVIALQASIRFNQDKFSTTPSQIFEIESKGSYIKFFIVANDISGNRGRIFAVDTNTGKFKNGISFYLNGKIVKEPVVTTQSWSFLGIGFSESLDFNSFLGEFRITGSVLINNISQYKSTNLQEIQRLSIRPWLRVSQSALEDLPWTTWSQSYNWNEVLVAASSDYFGVDPGTIFKDYTGTNKVIVDDTRTFKLKGYEYGAYRYLSSQSQIITAV
jgi:hypothetical protein